MNHIPVDLISQPSATLSDGHCLPRSEVEAVVENLVRQIGELDRAHFLAHSERFCETVLRVAPTIRPEMRMLVAGDWCCLANAVFEEIFGLYNSDAFDQKDGRIGYRLLSGREVWFNRVGVDLEKEAWPAMEGTYDLVVSMEIIEHLAFDPMHFMCEANRVLCPGGVLVTTTPNANGIQSIWNATRRENPFSFGTFSDKGIQHPKEYSTNELELLHRNSGFVSLVHETFSPYGKPDLLQLREALRPLGLDETMSGQVQVIAAKKVSAPLFRKYAPLYMVEAAFDDASAPLPDYSAMKHQWWGDCPELTATPAKPPEPGDPPFKPSSAETQRTPSLYKKDWPGSLFSTEEIQLLRACILPRDQAEQAFEEWQRKAVLDSLTNPQLQLVPMLYLRLKEWGKDHPEMKRIRGIHRYFWARNQMVLRNKDQLLNHFQENGVQTLLLKGSALNAFIYRGSELRAMNDFDFMVPPECGEKAIEIAERLGWKMIGRIPLTRNNAEMVRYLHALAFRSDRDGSILDIHWHLSAFHLNPVYDAYFWSRSVEAPFGTTTVRTLSPADTVFHLICHQIPYVAKPSLTWPMDLALLLERTDVSWNELVDVAKFSRLSVPTANALQFLRDDIGLSHLIPSEPILDLRGVVCQRWQKLEFQSLRRPRPSRSTFFQRLSGNLFSYARLSHGQRPRRWLSELGSFLRVANFYDYHPLWQGAINSKQKLLAVALAIRVAFVERFRRSGPLEDDIRNFDQSQLNGFHLPEIYQGEYFRWTEKRCSVLLDIEPGDWVGRIRLGRLRDLSDHVSEISVRFNSQTVENLLISETEITFQVRQEMFAPGTRQTLHLVCPALAVDKDPRELALSVFGIRLTPQVRDA